MDARVFGFGTALAATLFDAVQMSNLNFSGWSIGLGFVNLSRSTA